MNDIIQHIDWLGICLSLTAYFLMAKHRKTAITILVVSNLVWGTWAFSKGITTVYILNICYLILNSRTLYLWNWKAQVDKGNSKVKSE
jgi:hypothetical protein